MTVTRDRSGRSGRRRGSQKPGTPSAGALDWVKAGLAADNRAIKRTRQRAAHRRGAVHPFKL